MKPAHLAFDAHYNSHVYLLTYFDGLGLGTLVLVARLLFALQIVFCR